MTSSSRIAWSWRNLAHGAVLAVPAAVATVADPAIGFALAVGVLPAAAIGLRASRRERALVLIVGAVAGGSVFLGSLVAPYAVLAAAAVLVLCVGVAALAADPARRLAPVVMTLGLPLFGAGLSEASAIDGLRLGLLIVGGAGYGWLVSLAWPSAHAHPAPTRPRAPRRAMVVYGVQIGLAGAAAVTVGFLLGVDHPGWACTAALLVSRPDRRQLDARGWGRSASVVAGSLVACVVAVLAPAPIVFAALAVVTLAIAAATVGSRWYVFPFFSTVIVLSLLMIGEDRAPAHWFAERVGMTLVGVALALLSAWIVPSVARRIPARVAKGTP